MQNVILGVAERLDWLAETTSKCGDALIIRLLCLEQDGLDRLKGSLLGPRQSGEVNHNGTGLSALQEF